MSPPSLQQLLSFQEPQPSTAQDWRAASWRPLLPQQHWTQQPMGPPPPRPMGPPPPRPMWPPPPVSFLHTHRPGCSAGVSVEEVAAEGNPARQERLVSHRGVGLASQQARTAAEAATLPSCPLSPRSAERHLFHEQQQQGIAQGWQAARGRPLLPQQHWTPTPMGPPPPVPMGPPPPVSCLFTHGPDCSAEVPVTSGSSRSSRTVFACMLHSVWQLLCSHVYLQERLVIAEERPTRGPATGPTIQWEFTPPSVPAQPEAGSQIPERPPPTRMELEELRQAVRMERCRLLQESDAALGSAAHTHLERQAAVRGLEATYGPFRVPLKGAGLRGTGRPSEQQAETQAQHPSPFAAPNFQQPTEPAFEDVSPGKVHLMPRGAEQPSQVPGQPRAAGTPQHSAQAAGELQSMHRAAQIQAMPRSAEQPSQVPGQPRAAGMPHSAQAASKLQPIHRAAQIQMSPMGAEQAPQVPGQSSQVPFQPSRVLSQPSQVPGQPSQVPGQPSQVLSQPSQVLSQPRAAGMPQHSAQATGESQPIHRAAQPRANQPRANQPRAKRGRRQSLPSPQPKQPHAAHQQGTSETGTRHPQTSPTRLQQAGYPLGRGRPENLQGHQARLPAPNVSPRDPRKLPTQQQFPTQGMQQPSGEAGGPDAPAQEAQPAVPSLLEELRARRQREEQQSAWVRQMMADEYEQLSNQIQHEYRQAQFNRLLELQQNRLATSAKPADPANAQGGAPDAPAAAAKPADPAKAQKGAPDTTAAATKPADPASAQGAAPDAPAATAKPADPANAQGGAADAPAAMEE